MNKKGNSLVLGIIIGALIILLAGGYYLKTQGLIHNPLKPTTIPSSVSTNQYAAGPDKLSVSRSVTPPGQNNKNPMSFYKEIDDPATVQERNYGYNSLWGRDDC